MRGKGSTLICLLKSHTHPQSSGSLAQLSRFPSCLLSPPAASSPGRGQDTKGSLPRTHPTAQLPTRVLGKPVWERISAGWGWGKRDSLGCRPCGPAVGGAAPSNRPSAHPRAGRGGWEAPGAPRRKEGEGRARRVVLARKRTRASATRSWGGCPGDAPPRARQCPPSRPALRHRRSSALNLVTEERPERPAPRASPRPDRGAEPCAAPATAGRERGAWRGARAAGAAQPGGAGSRARGAPPLTHRARRAPPRTSTRCRCGNS